MKINFTSQSRKIKKENKIEMKKYFQILLLVFTVTVLTLILSFGEIIKKVESKQKDCSEYVSVFIENNLEKLPPDHS